MRYSRAGEFKKGGLYREGLEMTLLGENDYWILQKIWQVIEVFKAFSYVEISCLTSIKGIAFVITYLSGTLCAVIDFF